MNTGETHTLLEQKKLLKRGGSEELDQLLRQYPWFAAGHLLKAFNHQSEASAKGLWQKALLYGGHSPQISFIFSQLINPQTATFIWRNETEISITDSSAPAVSTSSSFESVESNIQDEEDAVLDADAISEAADAEEMQINLAKMPTSSNDKSAAILFEPYHTVDYFASQGIRLKDEKLGNDTLSNQVKTFTQWLRTMKKIYVEEEGSLEKKDEEQVLRIADNSNRDEMIVTETMAQVFLQQGKAKKAIDVYQKLSLLHPEKSGYFASLIESLNKRT